MSKNSVSQIITAFLEQNRFLLISHVRPDGDAIGSVLALGASLESIGKQVTIINAHGVPDNLAFMKGSEKIIVPQGEKIEADVVVALDTATRERLGDACIAVAPQDALWINIDHHPSNPLYGELNLIDSDSPATGQILYDLLKNHDLPIPPTALDALYIAISTDTGSFQYRNVTARTLEIVAEMIRAGIDAAGLAEAVYSNHPLARIQILKELLNVLQLEHDNQIAHWSLTPAMLDRAGAKSEDTEDLIDMIRSIRGVKVAVFFEQLPSGKIRISSRSSTAKANLSEICGQFGGGGHAAAAGASAEGTLDSVRKAFIEAIRYALDTTTDPRSSAH